MDFLMLGVFVVSVAFWVWIIYRISATKSKNKELMASSENKDPKDWSDEERRVRLQYLESMRPHLSFLQYDALKAKYTGTKSFVEQFGVDAAFQLRKNEAQDRASKDAQKEATKTIVKDAVIGGVVAGPAGAVVGAVVGKNKTESKKEPR